MRKRQFEEAEAEQTLTMEPLGAATAAVAVLGGGFADSSQGDPVPPRSGGLSGSPSGGGFADRRRVLAEEPEKEHLELEAVPAAEGVGAEADGQCEEVDRDAESIRQCLWQLESIQWHDSTSYEYYFSMTARELLQEKLASCSQGVGTFPNSR